jgi:hypothetical protein
MAWIGRRAGAAPAVAADLEKLEAAGVKYGIETVGPPVQFPATPAA